MIPPVLELLYSAYGFAGALPRAGMDPNQALARGDDVKLSLEHAERRGTLLARA